MASGCGRGSRRSPTSTRRCGPSAPISCCPSSGGLLAADEEPTYGWEQQSGATIDELVGAGKAKILYHPIAILDGQSSTRYSSRSAAASGCAAAAGVFPQYLKLLFANQPAEGSAGLPDDQLVALSKQAGARDTVGRCITDGTYAQWTKGVTDTASKAGVNSTPTILVNGKQIDKADQSLRTAVG